MRITRIHTTPVLAPLRHPVRTASGTIDGFPLVLIAVETDTGVTGHAYAQVYLAPLLHALERSVAALGSLVVGDPLEPRALHEGLVRRCRLFGMKGMLGVALGGLDMAWWDAWARARGQPLAQALGMPLRSCPAYYSVGLYDASSVGQVAREAIEAGFAGLKIKLGFPTLEEDLAAVRAAQQALGGALSLMVDYNQSLAPAEAMRRCQALDSEGLAWIEEPVLADDLATCARIADAVATPIQIGENFHGPAEMRAAIAARAMDLVMPDAQFIHGVTGWLEAAALAEAAGLPMSSHTFLEASAQLLCATPTAHWIEVLDAAGGLRADPLQLKDGRLVPSQAPGLGITWRQDLVERHRA